MKDRHALDAQRLTEMTGNQLQGLLSLPQAMPLQDQRAALLREVSTQQKNDAHMSCVHGCRVAVKEGEQFCKQSSEKICCVTSITMMSCRWAKDS